MERINVEGAKINPRIHELSAELVKLAKEDFEKHLAAGLIPDVPGMISHPQEIIACVVNSVLVAANQLYSGQLTMNDAYIGLNSAYGDLAEDATEAAVN